MDLEVEVGDVLFLDHAIPGLPYPTGIWVLCELDGMYAHVALVCNDAEGLYAIDNRYRISVKDIFAFRSTGEKARIAK